MASVLFPTVGYLTGWVTAELFDEGVSNTLCVESLRHGTNPLSYLQIRLFGGDPNYGGSRSGSLNFFEANADNAQRLELVRKNTNNNFYVFKDSEFPQDLMGTPLRHCFKRILFPKLHSVLSGYQSFATCYNLGELEKNAPSCLRVAIKGCKIFVSVLGGIFSLLATPIIKFHFSRIDPTRFQNDPDYGECAYRTSAKIEPWRAGFFGSLASGINGEWIQRFKAYPFKVITGVVQIIASLALYVLTISATMYITASRTLRNSFCATSTFVALQNIL